MEKREKNPSVSVSSDERTPQGKAVPAPVQMGIPAGISKAPWVPPTVESMGPVSEVTNGGTTQGPPIGP